MTARVPASRQSGYSVTVAGDVPVLANVTLRATLPPITFVAVTGPDETRAQACPGQTRAHQRQPVLATITTTGCSAA
jgi:hypothetical protein